MLLILAICTSWYSFGQSLDALKSTIKRLSIAKTVNFKMDSTGLSKLPKPVYYCSEGVKDIAWHVVDLNKDGQKDLIYSGPCQPYSQTAIFINNGAKLKKVYEYSGALTSIKSDDEQTIISILMQPMGCIYYADYIQVAIGLDTKIKKHTIEYHTDTKIGVADTIEKKHLSGVLRTQPIVNDSIHKDACTSDIFIGNQITKLTNKEVVIIDTQNKWSQVLYKKNEDYSIIGWMKQ